MAYFQYSINWLAGHQSKSTEYKQMQYFGGF